MKRPVSVKQAIRSPKAAARRESFCARMGGMRDRLTSTQKARDPRAKINEALKAWDCDDPRALKDSNVLTIPKGTKRGKAYVSRAVVKKPRKKNPVHPSSALRMRNVYGKELEKARELFHSFSGHDASPWKKVNIQLPKVALVVGRCDGVLYTTVRDGVTEKYIHRFKAADAPVLCASPDGKMLLLVGGAFEFTERGIVDDSSSK